MHQCGYEIKTEMGERAEAAFRRKSATGAINIGHTQPDSSPPPPAEARDPSRAAATTGTCQAFGVSSCPRKPYYNLTAYQSVSLVTGGLGTDLMHLWASVRAQNLSIPAGWRPRRHLLTCSSQLRVNKTVHVCDH